MDLAVVSLASRDTLETASHVVRDDSLRSSIENAIYFTFLLPENVHRLQPVGTVDGGHISKQIRRRCQTVRVTSCDTAGQFSRVHV